jgi:hypothetical protein
MNSPECTIACDYCGERPAFWFGDTSAAVCRKPECRRANQQNYDAHREEMNRQFESEEHMREIYGD